MTTPRVRGTRRLPPAAAVLNELSDFAELKERDGGAFVICGYSGPLTAVVSGHPEVCRLAEALLTAIAVVPVHEHRDRGEIPRCCFEVDGTEGAA